MKYVKKHSKRAKIQFVPIRLNYVRKWGSNDSETMKQIGVWYRLMGVFVEKGKWKKLVRHPLFTIAMYCLRLRVAIGYLQRTKRHHVSV